MGATEVAWYLTKAGRKDFGDRCRERDRDWWKDARMWVGLEDEAHDPTMVAALGNIIHKCPGWVDVVRDYARDKLRADPCEYEFSAEVDALIAEARRILRQNKTMQTDLHVDTGVMMRVTHEADKTG